MVPNNEKKKIIMWIRVYPNWKMNFVSKKWWEMKFSYETKASILLSYWGEWVYSAQSGKERWLLYESIFILIDKWTLILKNGRKISFPMKPKHQRYLSQ